MGFLIDAVTRGIQLLKGWVINMRYNTDANLAEIISSAPVNNAVLMQGCR
jgi:hypothetical protein